MKRLMIAGLIALGGCALTPEEVRERGPRYERTSKQAPEQVARCIGRNGEAMHGSFASNERPGTTPGTWEVTVRSTGEGAGTIAVAHVASAPGGSRVTTWFTSRSTNPAGGAEWLMKGC